MALPKNRQGVLELLKIFNARILGQTRPAMGCSCGQIHYGAATAVEIVPAGDDYPGQETHPVLWSVHMSEHPDIAVEYSYGCGLSEFIEYEELQKLFNEHLGTNRSEQNPYRLFINGIDRVDCNLRAAVRIMDNANQTRFCFDWGADQELAQRLMEIINSAESRSGRNILHTQPEFRDIVHELQGINPAIYKGGPDPKHRFESNWLLNYHAAIIATVKLADHIFVQNCGSVINKNGRFLVSADIVFAKKR